MPLGWPIYVKVKADKIWIIDHSHQLGFCCIRLGKSVLQLSYLKCTFNSEFKHCHRHLAIYVMQIVLKILGRRPMCVFYGICILHCWTLWFHNSLINT